MGTSNFLPQAQTWNECYNVCHTNLLLHTRNSECCMLSKWRDEPLATLKTNLPKLLIVITEGKEGTLEGRMVVKGNLVGEEREISY